MIIKPYKKNLFPPYFDQLFVSNCMINHDVLRCLCSERPFMVNRYMIKIPIHNWQYLLGHCYFIWMSWWVKWRLMVRLNGMNLDVNAQIVLLSALAKKAALSLFPHVSYFTVMSSFLSHSPLLTTCRWLILAYTAAHTDVTFMLQFSPPWWWGYHDVDNCERLCKEPLHWVEAELWQFNANWPIFSSHGHRFVYTEVSIKDCWIMLNNTSSDCGSGVMLGNIKVIFTHFQHIKKLSTLVSQYILFVQPVQEPLQ